MTANAHSPNYIGFAGVSLRHGTYVLAQLNAYVDNYRLPNRGETDSHGNYYPERPTIGRPAGNPSVDDDYLHRGYDYNVTSDVYLLNYFRAS